MKANTGALLNVGGKLMQPDISCGYFSDTRNFQVYVILYSCQKINLDFKSERNLKYCRWKMSDKKSAQALAAIILKAIEKYEESHSKPFSKIEIWLLKI